MKNVALIDDEELVRESVAQLLRIRDYNVTCYESAEAFLADRDSTETCIIVDFRLPGISGCDLIRQLRASGNNSPALLLSGNIDENLEELICTLPKVSTLAKPCLSSDLYAAVEACFRMAETS